jgi:hypothetical protein
MATWKDQLRALRSEVHSTFEWDATLHHATDGDISCTVKWHREGSMVGMDANMVLEEHEIVFKLSDLNGSTLERDTLISVEDVDDLIVSFKIMDVFDDNGYQQSVSASIQ